MGSTLSEIDEAMSQWIKRQKIFFVATAPMSSDGHINCSPKGSDTFRIIDGHTVAYLDLTGSGAETIAHLRENGRMVIMFCDFDGEPMIVRFHGRGEVVLPSHPEYDQLAENFPKFTGTRSIIRLNVSRISNSCGMAVPLMDFRADRRDLDEWAEDRGPEKLVAYRQRKNAVSIDGLPALDC